MEARTAFVLPTRAVNGTFECCRRAFVLNRTGTELLPSHAGDRQEQPHGGLCPPPHEFGGCTAARTTGPERQTEVATDTPNDLW